MKREHEDKMVADVEMKAPTGPETCEAKSSHRFRIGMKCEVCGTEIPLGPYTPEQFSRYMQVLAPSTTTSTPTSPEENDLIAQYGEAITRRTPPSAHSQQSRMTNHAIRASETLAKRQRSGTATPGNYCSNYRVSGSEQCARPRAHRLRISWLASHAISNPGPDSKIDDLRRWRHQISTSLSSNIT